MASDASTTTAVAGAIHFSSDFVAHLPSYQKAIRGQRIASWARQRGLEEDLVQLALLDLARIDARFDSTRAASPHHFRMAVLPSRVSDCADTLMRMYTDFVSLDEERVASDFSDEEEEPDEVEEDAFNAGDPVFYSIVRLQVARALREAVAALPPVQRRVFELALADCTDREIAEELGVSVQAIHTARKKGIAKVRDALGDRYFN